SGQAGPALAERFFALEQLGHVEANDEGAAVLEAVVPHLAPMPVVCLEDDGAALALVMGSQAVLDEACVRIGKMTAGKPSANYFLERDAQAQPFVALEWFAE